MNGSGVRWMLLMATALLGSAGASLAQDATVVIGAKRQAADEQVTLQVQKALAEDPWIYADHVTVTTKNGVVTLEGVVGDAGELLRIVRLCRKIPGTRRVSTSYVEINAQLPDGG